MGAHLGHTQFEIASEFFWTQNLTELESINTLERLCQCLQLQLLIVPSVLRVAIIESIHATFSQC